ncbi:hypothetical protein OPT61_g6927 [Boeremia exigua]|uniref:Uncharacterized protein n=1 Tax=Boeremia exigua TaxID=749465 RepID=A0ACC2I461_9PLEO|nr:hypothetical protein OPT61_g6927 [Boeremia exigua]
MKRRVSLSCHVSIDAAIREAVSAPMHLIAGNARTTTATGKSSLRLLTAVSSGCATSGHWAKAAVGSMWYGATMLESGRGAEANGTVGCDTGNGVAP